MNCTLGLAQQLARLACGDTSVRENPIQRTRALLARRSVNAEMHVSQQRQNCAQLRINDTEQWIFCHEVSLDPWADG